MHLSIDHSIDSDRPVARPAEAVVAARPEPVRSGAKRLRGRRLSWGFLIAVTLLAALGPAILWPGDTPWTNDEPLLIAHALDANHAHRLADKGLLGSLRIHYGPLPTQIYQAILLFTHDPLKIVVIRAALCSGVTALGLLWLARTLRLSAWFVPAVLLSPCVYLYNRILWDATFVVPLGSLALAAFASFLHAGSRRSLLTALACAASLPLIHPQTLPLFFALVGYLAWRHRPALVKHRAGVIAVALVLAALNATYFVYAADAALHLRQHVQSGYGARIAPQKAALTPLRGGQLLWDDPLSAGIERLGKMALLSQVVVTVARGIELLVWAGAAVVAWQAFRASGFFANPEPSDPLPERATSEHSALSDLHLTRRRVLGVTLAALLMQIVLYAGVGLPPWASYYFGPFPTTLVFAWVALESLARVKLRGAAVALYGLCVTVATAAGVWQVHRFGWPRGSESPTLGNQVEVARALNKYSDAAVLTDVTIYQTYPHALWTLRKLVPPDESSAAPLAYSGKLVIRYRSEQGGSNGRIELVEGGAPADAKPVALSETP